MAKPTKRDRRVSAILSGLDHPLRRRLLLAVAAADSTGTSPKQLSAALKEPLTNASYHMRELADKGLIKEKSTQQRRGAVEHYYVLTRAGADAVTVLGFTEELIR